MIAIGTVIVGIAIHLTHLSDLPKIEQTTFCEIFRPDHKARYLSGSGKFIAHILNRSTLAVNLLGVERSGGNHISAPIVSDKAQAGMRGIWLATWNVTEYLCPNMPSF